MINREAYSIYSELAIECYKLKKKEKELKESILLALQIGEETIAYNLTNCDLQEVQCVLEEKTKMKKYYEALMQCKIKENVIVGNFT